MIGDGTFTATLRGLRGVIGTGTGGTAAGSPSARGSRGPHGPGDGVALGPVEAFPDDKRAELVREVFGTIVVSRDGIAGFTLRPPFDQLASAAKGDLRKLTGDYRGGLVDAILAAA